VLTDGGVYDNLGLETVWKKLQTVLVSDAGGKMAPEGDPKRDWGRHAYRVLELIDNQVRSLRKRQLIGSYKDEGDVHNGAYWGIRSDIRKYSEAAGNALPAPLERTLELADTPTRLKRIDDLRQERLINWGYAICDAAIRRHVDSELAAPGGFPYERGV
jgi:NTE family protein